MGRKKMYKLGSGYTLEQPSSVRPVDCPQCLGSGKVPDPQQVEAIKEEIKKESKSEKKRKELSRKKK
jgi:hypothetical protein